MLAASWWLAAAILPAAAAPAAEVEVSLEALEGGRWRVTYALARPRARLDLGPAGSGFRASGWRVETPGLALVTENRRDAVVSVGGRRFAAVSIVVAPDAQTPAKDYAAISPFGRDGALLYTGHFHPWTEGRRRLSATFSVAPAAGGRVAAFGAVAPSLDGWTSPYDHPAFLYAGALAAGAEGRTLFIDPSVPEWIGEDARALAPMLFAVYERAFERSLPSAPDFFLGMGATDDPSRLGYDGDALPGQVLLRLNGGAWASPENGARALLERALAHEAAHLWLSFARPSSTVVPDWIHEGAADALAAESLGALGRADAGAMLHAARSVCAAGLKGRSLDAAERAGAWPAVYACGHVLAVAAARAHNAEGSVGVFWRDLVARAEAGKGYDYGLFLAVVRDGGGEKAAAAIDRFTWTNLADPEAAMDALLSARAP